jgi:hypothetical protein
LLPKFKLAYRVFKNTLNLRDKKSLLKEDNCAFFLFRSQPLVKSKNIVLTKEISIYWWETYKIYYKHLYLVFERSYHEYGYGESLDLNYKTDKDPITYFDYHKVLNKDLKNKLDLEIDELQEYLLANLKDFIGCRENKIQEHLKDHEKGELETLNNWKNI